MKGGKVQVFLIKLGAICFALGICSIILALVFFREGQAEVIWLIVFSVGAVFVLFWLFVMFFIGRCGFCGSFASIKHLRLEEDGELYCHACGELISYRQQKPPPSNISL